MKILDRYIIASITGSFLFGIAMFMVLIMSVSMLKEFVELVAEHGVAIPTALLIFAYELPRMLSFAFPMGVLLSILLVFNRMSSESEMVAIRAAGASFLRIVLPTLLFAVIVTAVTYWVSDSFAPFASKQSAYLTQQALNTLKTDEPISYAMKDRNGKVVLSVEAAGLDVSQGTMKQVVILQRKDGVPNLYTYAPSAEWDTQKGYWRLYGASSRPVSPGAPLVTMDPNNATSHIDLTADAFRLEVSPFDLSSAKKEPEELTSVELRHKVAELQRQGVNYREVNKWAMAMAQRTAMPFMCLVLALIGAPLGLRHHRTSSAVGLGVSLIIIFAYYSLAMLMTMFGKDGQLPPMVAAWTPNMLGTILGVVLMVRANR